MGLPRQQSEGAIIRMFNPPKPRQASRRVKAVRAFGRRYGMDAAAHLLDEIDAIASNAPRGWLFDTNIPWMVNGKNEPPVKRKGFTPIIEDN